MEDKIYSVLEKYGIDEPKASAITEDLLFLCAVSQQREQLIDFFIKQHQSTKKFNELVEPENIVDEYLKGNL
jgi:hypothetical protein